MGIPLFKTQDVTSILSGKQKKAHVETCAKQNKFT